MSDSEHRPLVLSGSGLALAELARVARDPGVAAELAPAGLARVARCRRLVEGIAERYGERWQAHRRGEASAPAQEYGVTTGFGEFKDRPVAPAELEELQRNILLSHSVGTGSGSDPDDPSSYYPAEVVRAALVLRLNTFLKGHSGLSVALVEAVAAMLAEGIVPLVPRHGSVGSSGDLCPLAHLFVVFLGHGRYYRVESPADVRRSWGELRPASQLAGDLGLELPSPGYKEGLALVNGATFAAALLALAVHDAERLAVAADVAAALTLEAMCGCARALDPKVHAARGQRGQQDSAANLRRLVAGSRLVDSAGAVQDAYSLRCAPAVHGASRDAAAYARAVAEREVDAATDNPLFFPGDDGALHVDEPWDFAFESNWRRWHRGAGEGAAAARAYSGREKASYSAGNFHGQPLAVAADALTLALAELADISERRTQLLLDRHHNRNLPANLIPRRGVSSGLMLAQYCAASIVSENKVLAHPASVDSIPTSANSEDHNSMATWAAKKLRQVLANAQAVLAVELLTVAQALEWRVGMERSPLGPPPPEGDPERDRDEAERFRAVTAAERRGEIAAELGSGSAAAYLAVREAAAAMTEDRPLDGDLLALRRLLEDGTLVAAVERALGQPLLGLAALRWE